MGTSAEHPEGYLEAFAKIYTQFSNQVRVQLSNEMGNYELCAAMKDVLGINEAIRGMALIENVVAASQSYFK